MFASCHFVSYAQLCNNKQKRDEIMNQNSDHLVLFLLLFLPFLHNFPQMCTELQSNRTRIVRTGCADVVDSETGSIVVVGDVISLNNHESSVALRLDVPAREVD